MRREAAARGVDPARLIFARRTTSLAEHLARHRAADLFLDTLPYNAHSTARDALWAGLPLVRDAGRPVKANLSLDAGLLAAIDEAAAARGLTRSAFLASAAREKIETQR